MCLMEMKINIRHNISITISEIVINRGEHLGAQERGAWILFIDTYSVQSPFSVGSQYTF